DPRVPIGDAGVDPDKPVVQATPRGGPDAVRRPGRVATEGAGVDPAEPFGPAGTPVPCGSAAWTSKLSRPPRQWHGPSGAATSFRNGSEIEPSARRRIEE